MDYGIERLWYSRNPFPIMNQVWVLVSCLQHRRNAFDLFFHDIKRLGKITRALAAASPDIREQSGFSNFKAFILPGDYALMFDTPKTFKRMQLRRT
jgi:hypothetical protein